MQGLFGEDAEGMNNMRIVNCRECVRKEEEIARLRLTNAALRTEIQRLRHKKR